MLVVVLKARVTEINETSCQSKKFDQLGEVGKRPCQTIDLVDDDDIDLSSANVVQQLLPSGARRWNRPRSRRRHNDPGSASRAPST
jgi:hypothetical protein